MTDQSHIQLRLVVSTVKRDPLEGFAFLLPRERWAVLRKVLHEQGWAARYSARD